MLFIIEVSKWWDERQRMKKDDKGNKEYIYEGLIQAHSQRNLDVPGGQ